MCVYETLATILREDDPASVSIPYMMPAVTDGRFFSCLGIQTYGFLPIRLPEEFVFMSTIHTVYGIPVDAVSAGANAIYKALQRFG
jgi:acetylornithine deacetylase/succinyl-diaminopimelate desuccinylase-like protein